MANITQTIPSLTAGISQQPDEQKIPGQVKDLENALPDVTHGLLKRPAGKFVGTLANAGDGKWFHYYRDENEQYIGQVHRNGTVKMWACTQVKDSAGTVLHEAGAPVTVVDGIGNATYLTHTKDSDIQTLTLNDFTYITNRTINTAMDETSAGLVPVGQFEKEVYVELKAVSYAKQYGLNLFDNTTTDTETRTTATRISVINSVLDTGSTCPNVGTEILSIGTGQSYDNNKEQIFRFDNLRMGGTNSWQDYLFVQEGGVNYSYELVYCPPPWTANTIYREGDLVTGDPDTNNNNAHTKIYKRTSAGTSGSTIPSGTSNTNWSVVSNSETFSDNTDYGSSPLHDGKLCLILQANNLSISPNDTSRQDFVEDFIDALQNTTTNPEYADLPFTIYNESYTTTGSSGKFSFDIKWKHNGNYRDQSSRIILKRLNTIGDITGNTFGGSSNFNTLPVDGGLMGDFIEVQIGSTAPTIEAGRSDLYFRLTTTGQAVPDDSTTDTDDYICRYTTTVDLLHGGSGWEEGDVFDVQVKDGVHTIRVDKISTSEVRANLGLIRPAPTSFDTKTTVTADSILGDMRNAIIAETGFDADDVEQIGSGLYIKKSTKFSASTPVGELLNVVTSQVNDIGDLPSQCKHGMVVEVVNSAADEDNHYVQFHGNGELDGEGVWEECAKPGRKKRFDYSKMPVALIRTEDGNFRLAELDGVDYTLDPSSATYSNAANSSTITVTLTDHGYSVGDKIRLTNNPVFPVDGWTTGVTGLASGETYALAGDTNIGNMSGNNHNNDYTGTLRYRVRASGNIPAGSWITADFVQEYWLYAEIYRILDQTIQVNSTDIDIEFRTIDTLLPNNVYTITDVPNANQFEIEYSPTINRAQTDFRVNIEPVPGPFTHPLWEDAIVGDDVTNPEPSFIGKPINKMLFFRNRLALLSEENIILSRPGDFFNFFATSAIQFIPSDPIDVSASSTYPATLYDGIQVNAGLILFTKNQQFMLTTDSDILSVQTVKINSISTYNFNSDTNPISLGTTIGFLDNANKHSRFFEMASALREGEPEVIEQSAVVSRLFDNDLKLISNSRENSVIFFSEGDSSTLYGYKYFDQINARKLASWFKWKMTGTISYHCMQDDNLFAVVKDAGDNNGPDYHLLKFSLKPEEDLTFTVDNGLYDLHLDHMYKIPTGTVANYDENADFTTIALPLVDDVDVSGLGNHTALTNNIGTTKLFAYNPTSGSLVGTYKQVINSATNANSVFLLVAGNWSQGTGGVSSVIPGIVVGFNYTMKVEIPTLYYQKQSGERWVSDTRADTILHRIKLGFGPVGTYETKLKCLGKADYDQVFEVTPTSNPYASGITNDDTLTTIPIYNRNINTSLTIESTHPTPMTLHNLTWEGVYTDKNYSRV